MRPVLVDRSESTVARRWIRCINGARHAAEENVGRGSLHALRGTQV